MKFLRQIRALFQKPKLDREMAEELNTHIEEQTRVNLAAGMNADEARYAAHRQFGRQDQIKEIARDQRGWVWLEQFLQDLRYAVRQLRRHPGFTAVAVLSLALGIGANTAIFSLVNDVLLKMLPVKNPRELVLLHWSSTQGWAGPINGSWETDPVTKVQTCTSFSPRAFDLFRGNRGALASVFAFAPLNELTLSVDGQAETSPFGGQLVSGGYYGGLGVPAVLGRMIGEEDDRPVAPPVAVISYRYWQQRFAGDPAVVGKTIYVNQAPVVIIGVTPREFLGALEVGSAPDISLPLALLPAVDAETAALVNHPGGMWWLRVMGRLQPGATPEQARAGLAVVFRQSAADDAAALPARASATAKPAPEIPLLGVGPGGRGLTYERHNYTRMLTVLMVLVGLVLVIACANVANLLLARGAARRKEIAARLALGASRSRLVRQLLTESGLLVALGVAVGAVLAWWGQRLLLAMNPLESRAVQPLVLGTAPDWRLVGFMAVVAMLSGLLVGLAPAWRATRVDLNAEFQGGGRNAGGGRSRLGKALLVVQVALSLVLLVGAGLFVRTLRNLENVDVGFNRAQLLLFRISALPPAYDSGRALALHGRIAAGLAAIPGVRGVSFSRMPLLSNAGWNTRVTVPGRVPGASGRKETAMLNAVGPDFFTTLGIPLLRGREFGGRDGAGAPNVALINEAMAKQYFEEQDPIGRHFTRSGDRTVDLEIVGVVRDAKYAGVRNQTPATIYVPFAQEAAGEANYAVRTSGDPRAVVASIRAVVRALDPNLPLGDLRTQDEQVGKLFASERFFARFSGCFGGLALVLVCVGLYGLMSYVVTCRTGEIGLRMALGAQPPRVLWMVLRESLLLIAAGALIGLGAAAGLTRVVAQMLYGIAPLDALTFGGMTLLLFAAAVVAAWRPAWRASKVDPMVALRSE